MASGIFAKLRPTYGQLRSVAERRIGDARCLCDSGDSERSNGAMYMAGFVVECLLKALLVDRHPNLAGAVDPAKLSKSDRDVHALLYNHELDDMSVSLPEIEEKLNGLRIKSGELAWEALMDICEQWTVYARYSSKQAKSADAKRFIETVEEVKKWLKEL